jgi:hypothetical protein
MHQISGPAVTVLSIETYTYALDERLPWITSSESLPSETYVYERDSDRGAEEVTDRTHTATTPIAPVRRSAGNE